MGFRFNPCSPCCGADANAYISSMTGRTYPYASGCDYQNPRYIYEEFDYPLTGLQTNNQSNESYISYNPPIDFMSILVYLRSGSGTPGTMGARDNRAELSPYANLLLKEPDTSGNFFGSWLGFPQGYYYLTYEGEDLYDVPTKTLGSGQPVWLFSRGGDVNCTAIVDKKYYHLNAASGDLPADSAVAGEGGYSTFRCLNLTFYSGVMPLLQYVWSSGIDTWVGGRQLNINEYGTGRSMLRSIDETGKRIAMYMGGMCLPRQLNARKNTVRVDHTYSATGPLKRAHDISLTSASGDMFDGKWLPYVRSSFGGFSFNPSVVWNSGAALPIIGSPELTQYSNTIFTMSNSCLGYIPASLYIDIYTYNSNSNDNDGYFFLRNWKGCGFDLTPRYTSGICEAMPGSGDYDVISGNFINELPTDSFLFNNNNLDRNFGENRNVFGVSHITPWRLGWDSFIDCDGQTVPAIGGLYMSFTDFGVTNTYNKINGCDQTFSVT